MSGNDTIPSINGSVYEKETPGLKLQESKQQKRATCFETMPQQELKSDVARFITHVQFGLIE